MRTGVSRWIDIPKEGRRRWSARAWQQVAGAGRQADAETLNRMVRVIAGFAALLMALCFATGALAHAIAGHRAEPADGSVLTQPPKTVQLHFNEASRRPSSA